MFHAFNKGELRYYDIFHQDKDYEAEAKALPLQGKTILEIGSGTGLMTKELRKLGYEVTTVDPYAPADYNYWWEVEGEFDNVLALYDVLNYMPKRERREFSRRFYNVYVEMWNKREGVKFFTYKRVKYKDFHYFGAGVFTGITHKTAHRIRFGIRIGNIALLKFIYWGKGLPAVAIHKLYL